MPAENDFHKMLSPENRSGEMNSVTFNITIVGTSNWYAKMLTVECRCWPGPGPVVGDSRLAGDSPLSSCNRGLLIMLILLFNAIQCRGLIHSSAAGSQDLN